MLNFECQVDEIRQLNVEYREFRFCDFPAHVRDLTNYAFKVAVLAVSRVFSNSNGSYVSKPFEKVSTSGSMMLVFV